MSYEKPSERVFRIEEGDVGSNAFRDEYVRHLAAELAATKARLAAEERMVRQAARLLRDYEADAHPEDVQDVIRWLAVYDSREQRATDSEVKP